MAVTVEEASDRFTNFMTNPPGPEAGVCERCRGFPNPGYALCYQCGFSSDYTDIVVPISYSVHQEQLHHELRAYKEPEYPPATRNRAYIGLSAVLWRFLMHHEDRIANAVGLDGFEQVTVVPSGSPLRDERPGISLRTVVGEGCGQTRDRFERLLRPSEHASPDRSFDPARYESVSAPRSSVLLIDDTWVRRKQSAVSGLRAQAGWCRRRRMRRDRTALPSRLERHGRHPEGSAPLQLGLHQPLGGLRTTTSPGAAWAPGARVLLRCPANDVGRRRCGRLTTAWNGRSARG